MTKYENTKVDFPINLPVVVTLDVDPTKLVGKEKEWSDGGKSTNFTYFCVGKLVFWANEHLHQSLLAYKKGDTVTIVKSQRAGQKAFDWEVTAGGEAPAPSKTNGNGLSDETIKKIDAIYDWVVQQGGAKVPAEVKKTNDRNPEESLDF